VPFTALFWTLTEPLRGALLPAVHAHTSVAEIVAANATAAGIAGAVAAAVTTPFDVIKTQQQIAGEAAGMWDTARRIHARGGWSDLFRGTLLRSGRAVPACAIVVSSYEVLKHNLAHLGAAESAADSWDFAPLAYWYSD